MTLKQDIETTVQNECFKGGFDSLVSVTEFSNRPHFEMHTSLETRETAIKYNPEYERENPGKSQSIVRDGARHEINHHMYKGFNGCPRTLDYHVDLIYNPIAEVILPKGYTSEDIHYVSNAFEDSVLHEDLSNGFSLQGIANFFEDIGETLKEKKFTPFYEAHVKLNMFLWGNKKQKRKFKKFYQNGQEVRDALKNFLERTGISNIRDETGKDREKIRDYLNDENNWQELAKVYAEEFSKLMQPGYAIPIFNHSGKGTKGKEQESPIGEGNEFDKQMKAKRFKRARVRRAYESSSNAPIWIDSFEALDLLYESLAQELTVKADVFTRASEMPIHWYGKRRFDSEKDDFKHIRFGFNDNGVLELKKKKWHTDMPLEFKVSQRGFPEARFGLLDTSGSMAQDFQGGNDIGNTLSIPWGDKSKYHGALVEFYGFIEYLKQNHLLNQTNLSLANFSKETILGKGLSEAKKTALTPQFNGTKLNLKKIKTIFEGRNNLIFTISDGYIKNWNSIRERFLEEAGKHVYFHLQLGDPNNMTEELENKGFHVEHITTPEELRGRTIDLTDKLLRKGEQSK